MIYENSFENFSVYLSLVLFFIFLLYVVLFQVAKGHNSYSNVNKAHKFFFIPYLVLSVYYAFKIQASWVNAIPAVMVGTFIYFTLQYVFLFALIGIAKKSISINILTSIEELSRGKDSTTTLELSKYMDDRKIGFNDIRSNRLEQMVLLGFALKDKSSYKLTPKGRKVNRLGNTILKIWNLKRL